MSRVSSSSSSRRRRAYISKRFDRVELRKLWNMVAILGWSWSFRDRGPDALDGRIGFGFEMSVQSGEVLEDDEYFEGCTAAVAVQ